MSRFEAAPDSLLRPYVQSYWGLVRDLSAVNGSFTVTPDCFLELIFFVNPPWTEQARGQQLPVCTLIPLLQRPLHLVFHGTVQCAAVRLQAWAAGILFPQASAATPQWFDLSASFPEVIPAVSRSLRQGVWEQTVALLDAALLGTFARARPAVGAVQTARTFARPLDQIPAETTIEVAARQGRSRRQIERGVRSVTHRSPKQLACLARFQFVRDTLWARPQTELAALAFEAGYADQAHLTRYFRRYAGCSPGEFIRDCRKLRSYLRRQEQNVAFVQDDLQGP